MRALAIADFLASEGVSASTLGELFGWSELDKTNIPWVDLSLATLERVSSFDSSQERPEHFLGALVYARKILDKNDILYITQGTDTLVNKASLFAILLTKYLVSNNKKIIFIGSPESGYKKDSLATPNVTVGLYAGLEEALPGGVYVVSSSRIKNKVFSFVYSALGSVKLHADGYFHSPNSQPVLAVRERMVYKTSLYDDLITRVDHIDLLPDILGDVLRTEDDFLLLEDVLTRSFIANVNNPRPNLLTEYDKGARLFVIEARGAGNAPEDWKNEVGNLIQKGDATVIVITLADSGDVQLAKYAAGLNIPGVLSGRTLREESAMNLAAVVHLLRYKSNYTDHDLQELIDRYCYLMGMVDMT